MFKLSRVPKKVPTTNRTASAATAHDATKQQPPNRTVGTVAKKRRRGPPIPSSFLLLEEELGKAERAFLEEEDEDSRNLPTKKIKRKDPMAPVLPKKSEVTAAKPKKPQTSHSKCNENSDDDSDDSILVLDIFTRKKEPTGSTDALLKQKIPSEITTRPYERRQHADEDPSTRRDLPTVEKENDRVRASIKTTAAAVDTIDIDSSLSSTVVGGVFSASTVSTPPSAPLPPPQSLSSSSAAIIASISEALKRRIDAIMAAKPLHQISFREIRAQFTESEIDKHTLKVYVHNKMGLETPPKKHKNKSKNSNSSSNVSQDANKTANCKATTKAGTATTTAAAAALNASSMGQHIDTESSTLSQVPLHQSAKTVSETTKLSSANPAAENTEPLFPSAACVDLLDKSKAKESVPTVPPAKKKGRAPRKRVTKRDGEEATAETTAKPKEAPKRKREPAKKCCQLCSQCPCRLGKESDDVAALNVSQSDQGVEKSLIKRLQKVQKVSERYANQEDAVRRQLKNHRRDMWRKRERLQEMARQNRAEDSAVMASRFLPDVDEIEQHFYLGSSNKKGSTAEKDKARGRVFGPRKSYQPTLTQLMGGSSESNQEEKEGKNKESQGNIAIYNETNDVEEPRSISLGPSVEEGSSEVDADNLPEGEPVPVETIQWIDGKARGGDGEPVVSQSSTLWSCSVTGRPYSTWDRLFDDPASTENMGMDDLLDMFDGAEAAKNESDSEKMPSPQRVDMSMLTPGGYDRAQRIVQRISKSPRRLEMLKSVCPNWEENVCFAMHQRDKEEIAKALAAIQEERERFERGKVALENFFLRHSTALSVFEETLFTSLKRLDSSQQQNDATASRSPIDEDVHRPAHRSSSDASSLDMDHSQLLTQDEEGEEEEEIQDDEIVLQQNAPKDLTSHGTSLGDTDHSIHLKTDFLKEKQNTEHISSTNGHDSRVVDYSIDKDNNAFWTLGRNSVDTDAATLIATATPRWSGTWTGGRRSIDTDAETLIATASPRRSSIAACRSPSTPSTSILLPSSNLFVASQ
eukprot:scaffold3571_cov176-Amphora_coffeaeformis.AAC.20